MRLTKQSIIPMFALISACSQAQPLLPAPAAPAAETVATPVAVVVDFGAPHGRTATLSMLAPKDPSASGRYHLQAIVHRWVAADIAEYDVTLKSAPTSAGPFVAIGGGITTTLPTTGPSAATQAVFANLSQGTYYRAYVTAKGNINHTDSSQTLNTTPATADFDFTATQDVASTVNDTATVFFDSVGFSGTGNLTFGAPTDGGFSNPPGAPTVTTNVVVPPTITELPNHALGLGVAVDPKTHNVWATNSAAHTVTELTSTGSVLGTFTVDSDAVGLAVDPVNEHVWVTSQGTNSVLELTSTGSVLGSFSSGISLPIGLVVDPNTEHVWVMDGDKSEVTALTSTGSVLGLFSVGSDNSPTALAVDPINDDVWVVVAGSGSVTALTSTGSLLESFTIGVRPFGVAVDPNNEHVWVTDRADGTVTELTSTGSVLGSFAVGLSPYGVAVDARNGNVWVLAFGDGSLTELSSTGSVLSTFDASITPVGAGVAVDPGTGHVWLTEAEDEN